jgi:hypothetical protein
VVAIPIVGNYRNSNPILSRKICLEINKSRKFLFRGKTKMVGVCGRQLNRTRGWRSVECSASKSCIRSSCTSTIEMGWSNSILQPQSCSNDRSLLQNRWPSSLESEGDNSDRNRYANQNVDHPINSTIEGGVIGWLDSGHLNRDNRSVSQFFATASHRAALLPLELHFRESLHKFQLMVCLDKV